MKNLFNIVFSFNVFSIILLLVLSLFGGTIFTCCHRIYEGNGYLPPIISELFPEIILSSVAFALVLLGLDFLILWTRSKKKIAKSKLLSYFSYLTPQFNAKSILTFSLILFLLWLPWIIALYPASMNWDTYYQITQCYIGQYPVWQIPYAPTNSLISNSFSDHHPIFDTLIFGFFARTSDMLFGSWNQGVFCYIFLQAFLISGLIALFLSYLRHFWKIPSIALFATFLFFGLFPIFPTYAATMLKDTIHLIPFIFL